MVQSSLNVATGDIMLKVSVLMLLPSCERMKHSVKEEKVPVLLLTPVLHSKYMGSSVVFVCLVVVGGGCFQQSSEVDILR